MARRDKSWVDEEPGLRDATRELGRLFRRARSRLITVVVLAAAIALTVAAKSASAGLDDSYASQIVFRITEQDSDDPSGSSRPPREFRRWVSAAAFSGPRLQRVIEKHHLYPDFYARDPQLAIEAMRDDIDILVWRNYFLWQYLPEGEGDDSEKRSVRVAVAFHNKDPELAYDVVHELGELIIDLQEQGRLALAEEAKEEASAAVLESRVALERAHAHLVEQELKLARAPKGSPQAAVLKVEVAGMAARATFLEDYTKKLEQLRGRIGLREGIERQQLGLVFELVDHGAAEEPPPLTRKTVIILVAILSFLVLLPLLAMVIGAFDPRILDLDDVRRLGLVGLGRIPAFSGDNFGSLRARQRRVDRVH